MSSDQENVEHKTSHRRSLGVGNIILSVLFLLATAAAGYFYYQYRHASTEKTPADDVTKVTAEIGALIELPTGETPTLATVADKDKLAEQPFFQKAENGDKVLIYTNSGRAILYRPSIKKIVDVTTVNIQNNTTSSPTAEQPAVDTAAAPPEEAVQNETVKVAFLNGSTKIGVTQLAEEKLLAAFPEGVTVIAKEKALKSDYQGVLVVVVQDKAQEKAQAIAAQFKGTVGSLPEGETVPGEADILVIMGNSGAPAEKQ
jgi:hypothetical protein